VDLETGGGCFTTIYFAELWDCDHTLVEENPDGVGQDIAGMVAMADMFRAGIDDAREQLVKWKEQVASVFADVELLALPTLPIFPPHLDALAGDPMELIIEISRYTSVFNAAGTPATAQPIAAAGSPIPTSLQLVGPAGSEELLLATAKAVEAANA
ncbi:MAG: amidase, partial [Frankiaceae bacterium]|nr:amidase [Frankiaceae bacterium]